MDLLINVAHSIINQIAIVSGCLIAFMKLQTLINMQSIYQHFHESLHFPVTADGCLVYALKLYGRSHCNRVAV